MVEGRLWGAMIAASLTAEPLPMETEARMGEFTELVVTAISNIQARSDLAASRARIVAAATRSAGGWYAISTTELSSAWSTRSSR